MICRFVLLAFTVLMMSCAHNAVTTPSVERVPEIVPFKAERWLIDFPKGEFSIGVSYSDYPASNRAEGNARDFAAVFLSRNHASYIVDKESLISLSEQTELLSRSASFNLVVSENLPYLRRAANELRLLSSFNANGYMFGLYGFDEAQIDSSRIIILTDTKPDWAETQGVSSSDGFIYSTASSRQASLMDALGAAQELALRYAGQYLISNVLDIIRTDNDVQRRSSAFETVTRSQNFMLDKLWIIRYKLDNTESYQVYIRLINSGGNL